MQILEEYIKSKIDIDQELLPAIVSLFRGKNFTRDQEVIRVGQYVKDYYFIATGGVRIVVETESKEITSWIIFENNFFSDLESLKNEQPAKGKILALDDTTILTIPAKKMYELFDQYPQWQKFGRLIIEDAFLNVVDTLMTFQAMDAESRYLNLLRKSDAVNKIPLKQLASYLGITPTSLSRIRKNIR
ncbi:hypothetical protein BKI52_17035 [marine bacterium AO1-C]|nr:hypothetical protein BKI52_17035 [marine bacterium AO1-C]